MEAIEKAVEAISRNVSGKQEQLRIENLRLAELQKRVTSVQPTVVKINVILQSFGFSSFRLRTAGERDNLYEIIRSDGTGAAATLSEGEKSFVCFLYFYYMLHGSMSENDIISDRIVVFDDPVSSLDSDVLFVVSSLIKRVIQSAISGERNIKQVFLLTHNIYFHKEVSFDPKRGAVAQRHETFWIVRKVDGESKIAGYRYNPIKTSYELLWAEVRNPDRSRLTIQNTLRRIVENYFKILGNIDVDKITAKFDGADQQICASLFAWVNDGSHSAHDDLYVSVDQNVVEQYLSVFRQIFEKTDHMGHYYMMMGLERREEEGEGNPMETA